MSKLLKIATAASLLCQAMTATASDVYIAGVLRNTGDGWAV